MGKKCLIISLILSLILVSGCWSKMELNELAIVLGTAIDKGSNDNIRLTVQTAKPSEISTAGSGGGGGQGSPTLTLTREGKTTFDAVRNFVSINSRKLLFSHNQVLIIGEDLAKKGISEVIDFLERDPELRTDLPILISKGPAQNILNIPGNFEKASALEIKNELERTKFWGKTLEVELHDFILKLDGELAAPVAPRIERVNVNGTETFRVSGLGVFKGDKLIGSMNETETRGLLWVLGKVQSGSIVVDCPRGKDKEKVNFEVLKAKSKIEPKIEEGKPVFYVEIEEQATMAQLSLSSNVMDPKYIKQLEKIQAEAIKKEIQAALDKSQKKLKVDPFGFGEKLKNTYPRHWEKIRENWEKVYQTADVRLKVKTTIKFAGEKIKLSRQD